jgi:hypothetical protein
VLRFDPQSQKVTFLESEHITHSAVHHYEEKKQLLHVTRNGCFKAERKLEIIFFGQNPLIENDNNLI